MLVVASALVSRPLLPVDETRYMSVAWEAHVRGDYLVSHLNTQTYAHKPPLLFWFINAVWAVTDFNEFATRLVSPVAGIVCIVLTSLMARRLWPDSTAFHRCAPLMHATVTLWVFFCPLTMFDMLLTCFTQLALLGVLRAESGAPVSGWLITGLALGLGILSKGPVILVHVLPAALAAPWWSARVRSNKLRWYPGCLMAIFVAAAVALSWALPSAAAGGAEYGDELLFGQTQGRVINSFAHRQPFWWYLPLLPLCLLPWIFWGTVWRSLSIVKLDSPLKFLACWAGGSLLIHSLVSGKQIYYLLPAIPAFAMILARLATLNEGPVAKRDLSLIIAGTIGMGALPLFANHIPPLSETPLRDLIADWYSIPLIACGVALVPFTYRRIESAVFAIGTSSVLFFVIVVLSVTSTVWKGFDLRPLAGMVASHESSFAWYGHYHGELNYLGDIRYIHEVRGREELEKWAREVPRGRIIIRLKDHIGAMQNVGIAASGTTPLTSAQLQQVTQLLRSDDAFLGHEWQPTVTHLYWIRRGLPVDPYAVIRFDAPPAQQPISNF